MGILTETARTPVPVESFHFSFNPLITLCKYTVIELIVDWIKQLNTIPIKSEGRFNKSRFRFPKAAVITISRVFFWDHFIYFGITTPSLTYSAIEKEGLSGLCGVEFLFVWASGILLILASFFICMVYIGLLLDQRL